MNSAIDTEFMQECAHQLVRMTKENAKEKLPSMRIELISEDIYSFAEVISEYETSVLTVKLRGRIRAVSSLIRWGSAVCIQYVIVSLPDSNMRARNPLVSRNRSKYYVCTSLKCTIELLRATTSLPGGGIC